MRSYISSLKNLCNKSNCKNIIIFTSIPLIFLLILFSYFKYNSLVILDLNKKHQAIKDDVIVAKFNNQNIYLSEIQNNISLSGQDIDFNSLDKSFKEMLIKNIILERILIEKAVNEKFIDNKTLDEVILLVKSYVRHKYLDNLLASLVKEDDLRKSYENIKSSHIPKTEYEISHILVNDIIEANKVVKDLYNISFEEAAKKYSIDESNSVNGGYLGYVTEDNLVAEFASNLVKLKEGSISKPFSTKFGAHIVKLHNVRQSKIDDFDSMKGKLQEDIINNNRLSYIEQILSKYDIDLLIN